MNEKHGESTPFVSPDSFRKILQTLKSLYDSHTKKNYGRTDMNGAQYVGTVENFGSEILFESRKMLMDKPPMMNLFVQNSLSPYFDLSYSCMIETYDQQNMICAILKKDVLLDNKAYYLKFTDCSVRHILRSESWSDPTVKRDEFIQTKTAPILVIHDNTTDTDTEVELTLKTLSNDTTYYFYLGRSTETFVYLYDETTHELRTNLLSNAEANLPFIWICVPELQKYENLNYDTFVDQNGNPLLTTGTDGHAVTRLYPLIYGADNVPTQTPEEEGSWFIIAYPTENEAFTNAYNPEGNFCIDIGKIQYVYKKDITSEPIVSSDVYVVNTQYANTLLSRSAPWKFRTPKEGDADYDGTTYQNRCQAYLSLQSFSDNTTANPKDGYKAAFDVKFDDEYLTSYEKLCGNAVSGVHVNAGSTYSDNSIPNDSGLIHGLSKFNGLPRHLKSMLDRSLSCPRVAMYAIRDKLNDSTQTPTDKQTAAIILDSAIPKNALDVVTPDMKVVIRYDDTTGTYVTIPDEESSVHNALSEITYVDGNLFGNSGILKYVNAPKFVYHGSRTFSLGVFSLDPDSDYGRAYCISNDPISYENNQITKYPKPNRTLARICDIPTSFVHLINIKGKAPTVIIDDKYVKQEANLTRVDLENIWNRKVDHVMKRNMDTEVWYRGETSTMNLPMSILPYDITPSSVFSEEYMNQQYYRTLNLNPTLNLYQQTAMYEFDILDSGSGYAEGDQFKTIIGGLSLNGTVDSVDMGAVTSVSFSLDDECIVHPSLLDQYGTTLPTTTVLGSGYGLKLLLKLKDGVWESLHPIQSGLLNDLRFYQLDKFGNVYIRDHYDAATKSWGSYQLTGERISYHECDLQNPIPQEKRSTRDVYLYHTLEKDRTMPYAFSKTDSFSMELVEFPNGSWISNEGYTVNNPYNRQDSITWNYLPYNSSGVRVTKYEYPSEIQQNTKWIPEYSVLPRFHALNLVRDFNMTNQIRYEISGDNQPIPYLYLPNRDMMYTATPVMKDVTKLESQHQLSFLDLLDEEAYRIINEQGEAKNDIYRFNDCGMTNTSKEYQLYLESLGRDSLVETVREIDPNASILDYEGTPYAYSATMLKDYLMTYKTEQRLYEKDKYQLFRNKGSAVYDYTKNEPVGDQPNGKFESLTTKVFKPTLNVSGSNSQTRPVVFVRLKEELPSLDHFRLYDSENFDISDYAILIMSNKLYVHQDDTWVQIQTQR